MTSLPQTRARLREPDAPAGEPGGLIYLSGSSQRNNHCVPPFPSGLQRGEKRKDAHAHHPVGGFLAPRALRRGKAGHLPRDPQVCLLPWLHIKAPGKPGKASPAAPSTIPQSRVAKQTLTCKTTPAVASREDLGVVRLPPPPPPAHPEGAWLLPHGPLCCSGQPARLRKGARTWRGWRGPGEPAPTWICRGAAGRSQKAGSAGPCRLQLTGL